MSTKKPLTSTHKDNTPDQKDDVIQRLLEEVRALREQADKVRSAVSSADMDFDRMSVVGGINRLAKERREAQEEVRKLNRDLERLIRSSK